VELILQSNSALIPVALVANSGQIGGLPIPNLLQATEQGLPILVIAGTHVAPLGKVGGMVARAGSGIAKASDMIGKKVGHPAFGGSIDVNAKKWVQAAGVDYHAVTWVEVPFPRMADALGSGLVDALAVVTPFYTRIIQSNIGYEFGDFTTVTPPGTMPVVFVATKSWMVENGTAWAAFRAPSTTRRNSSRNLLTVTPSAPPSRDTRSCRPRSRRRSTYRTMLTPMRSRKGWPTG
jgi:NitT/TauT family transport system substrate-binding protein